MPGIVYKVGMCALERGSFALYKATIRRIIARAYALHITWVDRIGQATCMF